ncbi:MAG: zinc ribbon domain-containing protein [Firmicutes bacterium]|nr:zinc ribbon domain-containing protein [Bacillota bacterium]
MPIFEFKCRECDNKFEELLQSSDISRVTCPNCGSGEIKRLISTFAFGGESGFKTSTTGSNGCRTCSGGSCSTCH